MSIIQEIREKISQEIFNHTQVLDILRDYSKPRDVISNLLRRGDIIRIRKGLYVFGKFWRRYQFNKELLANLIYGPSIISLDYVLSISGLIPESVSTLTSITTGRSRIFETPVGRYSYKQLNKERFSYGSELHKTDTGSYFAANPLKALADKIWLDKRFKPISPSSYAEYLFDDLRIDEKILEEYLNAVKLDELEKVYSSRKISWFIAFLKKEFRIV
ncbi:MAG: hypothetical protein KJ666_01165 [Bacteroidetes bacterium]|nr:hypothetical protein [Bacteroidota bacterium]MBU2585219.1 hypothetical protein [Bacteroidota bacterium]